MVTLDEAFALLVKDTVQKLNLEAKGAPDLFLAKSGKKLEPIVYETMCECSVGTPFETDPDNRNGRISLISGQRFPDIVIAEKYGVEVKSTTSDKWQSIGSSINESTRVEGVEQVYMLFGKLGGQIEFSAKYYQECLDDIVVTHYPRYRIDMRIQEKKERTIFEKMGIDYDALRREENPIPLVAEYYKRHLSSGQRLWWADGNEANEDSSSPITIRMWNTVPKPEREELVAKGFVYFPQVCGRRTDKYNDFLLWLITEQSVVCGNVRDLFSAGGTEKMTDNAGEEYVLSAVCRHLRDHIEAIKKILKTIDSCELERYWGSSNPVPDAYVDRLYLWKKMVTEEMYHDDSDLTAETMNLLFEKL